MVNIVTENIGAMPLIAEYLKRMRFAENIDSIVAPLRSNNRRLSHGQTCFVIVLYLLCRPRVLYKLEEWVQDTTYLKVIFPEIETKHLTDDRIADTLKALHEAGISQLFTGQTIEIMKEFKLSMDRVHCDFTSFTVHGDYEDADGEKAIAITYGFSKDNQPDKKQFMQEVAVTSDGGVPVSSQTIDGNTSDVTRYVPVWRDIKQLMGTSDFLIIGDCKLSSEENLLTISRGSGYYLAPLAMYSTLERELREKVLSSSIEPVLLKRQEKDGETITYHGFEAPGILTDEKTGIVYAYRKIFILSSQLKALKIKSLESRLEKAMGEIEIVKGKLNHSKKLDDTEKINSKISSILGRYNVKGLIEYTLTESVAIISNKVGKGRVGANSEFRQLQVKTFNLEFHTNSEAVKVEKELCGYFVLATNKGSSQMSMAQALSSYKQEWVVERIFERLKGPLQVIPIFLELPEHIESMMYLLMSCAQLFTLMDREAKKSLEEKQEKLAGMFPNKIKTGSPKTENIMDKFRNICLVFIVENEEVTISISGLNPLQAKLLQITRANPIGFAPGLISERLNRNDVKEAVVKKAKNMQHVSILQV